MEVAGSGMARIVCPRAQDVHSVPAVWRHCMLIAMIAKLHIERCSSLDHPGWLEFRLALWPDADSDDHRGYMAISLAQPERFLQLMIYDDQRRPVGFIEGSIRSDYVNGTESSPVGFIEGVSVVPAWRRQGLAGMLFDAVGDWARGHGCRELASDALLDNEISQRTHLALGFRETERVVYFARPLIPR